MGQGVGGWTLNWKIPATHCYYYLHNKRLFLSTNKNTSIGKSTPPDCHPPIPYLSPLVVPSVAIATATVATLATLRRHENLSAWFYAATPCPLVAPSVAIATATVATLATLRKNRHKKAGTYPAWWCGVGSCCPIGVAVLLCVLPLGGITRRRVP